ncbi:RNA 2',3'-cyclic phosphodiesterase [Thalassotalea ganghwensis]
MTEYRQRMFIALDLNDADKNALASWYKAQGTPIGRAVPDENYHITLAFLGSIDKLQESKITQFIDSYLSVNHLPIAPHLLLGKLSLFVKPQVAYFPIENLPASLSKLAQALSQYATSIGLFQEQRAYCPHITVARKVKSVAAMTLPNFAISVSSFSLYHSQSTTAGVHYSPVRTWPLIK